MQQKRLNLELNREILKKIYLEIKEKEPNTSNELLKILKKNPSKEGEMFSKSYLLTSLSLLEKNDPKISEIFHKPIVDALYFLSSLYEKVYVCKPNTSNIILFDKYIVCKNFIHNETSNLYLKLNYLTCEEIYRIVEL